jgi:hypothetical protein
MIHLYMIVKHVQYGIFREFRLKIYYLMMLTCCSDEGAAGARDAPGAPDPADRQRPQNATAASPWVTAGARPLFFALLSLLS